MNILSQLTALREQTRGLTLVERAQHCCGLAKQLEKAGEYEAACEALNEFWPEREEPPMLEGLNQPTKANVLLRVGALTGWLGSADQIQSGQEKAKNLITQSVEIFEELGQSEGAAEAHTDLAICYWREGSFDEARINLADALRQLKDDNRDLRAVVLIWSGLVEVDAGRVHEALRLYNDAAPVIEQSEDHAVKGAFHNEFGLVFRRLAAPENREDYLDKALIEYAAASFHFEQAGNDRYLARVENNLGNLFFTIGRYGDAHKHLDRARQLFLELKDVGTTAQVDDTRARTLLAEALTTHGIALARLGNYTRSKALLERAINVAETAGDLEGAGRAQLSIIEELGGQTSTTELTSIYKAAAEIGRAHV